MNGGLQLAAGFLGEAGAGGCGDPGRGADGLFVLFAAAGAALGVAEGAAGGGALSAGMTTGDSEAAVGALSGVADMLGAATMVVVTAGAAALDAVREADAL